MPRSKSRVQIPSPAPVFCRPSLLARVLRVEHVRRGSQVVRPRSAKPPSPVRFRPAPPVSTLTFISKEVPRYARDFGSGLPLRSRPLSASSSIPARASSFHSEFHLKRGPSLRSGFRQREDTSTTVLPTRILKSTTPRRRGTQVVRERSAKPLYVGSIPTRASSFHRDLLCTRRSLAALGISAAGSRFAHAR